MGVEGLGVEVGKVLKVGEVRKVGKVGKVLDIERKSLDTSFSRKARGPWPSTATRILKRKGRRRGSCEE